MSTRPRLLMAVYNPIEVDGRVKRAADALADDFDLTLLCRAGQGRYVTSRYEIVRLDEPGGRLAKLRSHLRFWSAYVWLAWRMRPAVVYAHDFFLPFVGWIAARVSGARLVYDAHELIVPEEGEKLTPRDRLFYWLERTSVRHADVTIAANVERGEVMHGHYALPRQPVVVGNVPPIPHTAHSDAEIRTIYPSLSRDGDDEIQLVYQGDVNLDRGLLTFIDALDHLESHFVLVVIGKGPHAAEVAATQKGATSAGRPRLRYVGGVPHAHLFDMIRQCDIGIVTYSMRGLNNILCAPNKIFEYAHAGLPMVATCQAPIARAFRSYRLGCLIGCAGETAPLPAQAAAAVRRVAAERAGYATDLTRFLSDHQWASERARLVSAVREVADGARR